MVEVRCDARRVPVTAYGGAELFPWRAEVAILGSMSPGSATLATQGPAGNAHARLMRSRDVVAVAREQLARDPLLFLHPAGAGCAQCDLARRSIDHG